MAPTRGALPAGVVFDLDDTLLDTSGVEGEMLLELCALVQGEHPSFDAATLHARWGEHRDRLYVRVLDGSLDLEGYRRTHLQAVLEPCGELSEELIDGCLRLRNEQIERCRLLEHALDVLSELRAAGVRTSLLTNGPSSIQRRKLELIGLAEHLDGIAISGEIGVAKPDVGAFEAALALIDCRPGDAVMVGDNVDWDVHGAIGAGMLGAVWLAGEDAGEAPAGAIRVSRLRDVPDAIARVVAA